MTSADSSKENYVFKVACFCALLKLVVEGDSIDFLDGWLATVTNPTPNWYVSILGDSI